MTLYHLTLTGPGGHLVLSVPSAKTGAEMDDEERRRRRRRRRKRRSVVQREA